jgi:hypothetical protein
MGWIENLPWWVKWAFSGGVGLLSAFAATIVPGAIQFLLVGVGVLLIVVAAIGTAWHYWHVPKTLVAWKAIDPLRLDQAAWIWCGQCPQSDMNSHGDIYLQFEKLKRAVGGRLLVPDWTPIQNAYFQASLDVELNEATPSSLINEATPVRRAALYQYSQRIGDERDFFKD